MPTTAWRVRGRACALRDARCVYLAGVALDAAVVDLAREQRLRCHSHMDERCAGFFALGLAKASGLPVAITCTSGTAVAELLPAVVEAHEARVPLIVLSADRPPELRELGAGQTIDQLKIFGDFAKWFFEVGTHEATSERVRWIRALACRAWWTALEGRPGVVHLNFPLREPLVCDEQPEAHARDGLTGGHIVSRPARASGRRRRLGGQTPTGRLLELSGRPAWRAGRGTARARRHSDRPPRASARLPDGRCLPTRCRAPAEGTRPSPITTRCCATRTSPASIRLTSFSASAICLCQSHCVHGLRASRTRARWHLTRRAPGKTRRASYRTGSRRNRRRR